MSFAESKPVPIINNQASSLHAAQCYSCNSFIASLLHEAGYLLITIQLILNLCFHWLGKDEKRKIAEYEERTMMIYVLCTYHQKPQQKTKIKTGKQDNSPGSVTINTGFNNDHLE